MWVASPWQTSKRARCTKRVLMTADLDYGFAGLVGACIGPVTAFLPGDERRAQAPLARSRHSVIMRLDLCS